MRFLIDASLSPVVARALTEAGHDAVHLGQIAALHAPDDEVFDLGARESRVIVAADTDFGELLARRHASAPSVVLFRRQSGRQPAAQAELLLAHLPDIESDLGRGAIVVIEETRLRVRDLPIGGEG